MKLLSAGGKEYELHSITGKVLETGKNLETKVHGGGGGGATYGGYGGTAPVSIRSTTIVHDQIFLTDEQGNEHSFQLQGFNVACREANLLSVVWAIKKGARQGPYIAVINKTTNCNFFEDKTLQSMFRYPVWYMLAALLLSLSLGAINSLFYWGLLLVPVVWFMQGVKGAKKFKAETNFRDF